MPTKPTGRPRGRPPGAKNGPKTLEEFVFKALKQPLEPPSRSTNHGQIGAWAHKTPEERSAYSARLRAARTMPTRQTPGKPRALTNTQWAEVSATARLDAKRIIKKLKDAGTFPEDEKAAEALEKAVVTLRASQSPKDVAALARLILDFTKAKPAQKSEVTIRTHEDFLDEIAGDID